MGVVDTSCKREETAGPKGKTGELCHRKEKKKTIPRGGKNMVQLRNAHAP